MGSFHFSPPVFGLVPIRACTEISHLLTYQAESSGALSLLCGVFDGCPSQREGVAGLSIGEWHCGGCRGGEGGRFPALAGSEVRDRPRCLTSAKPPG